jgi:hypothetical protein
MYKRKFIFFLVFLFVLFFFSTTRNAYTASEDSQESETTLSAGLSDGGPSVAWTEKTDTGLYLVTQVKNGFYWKTLFNSDGRNYWEDQGLLSKNSFWATATAPAQGVSINGTTVYPTSNNGPTVAWGEKRTTGWVVTVMNKGAYWEINKVNDTTYTWGNKGAVSSLGAPAVNGIYPYTSDGPKSAWEEEEPDGSWMITIVNQGKYWKRKYDKNGTITWVGQGTLTDAVLGGSTATAIEGVTPLQSSGPEAAWGIKKTTGQWVSTVANLGAYWEIGRMYTGNHQTLTTLTLPSNKIIQSYWRANQGWTRTIPLKADGNPDWAAAPYWTGPLSPSILPGTGDLMTFSTYTLPAPANKLMQSFWRKGSSATDPSDDEGYLRGVPLVNGNPDFNQAESWNTTPFNNSGLPATGHLLATETYYLPTANKLMQQMWIKNASTGVVSEWIRTITIRADGTPDWSSGTWTSNSTTLPQSGVDIQAMAAYVLPTTPNILVQGVKQANLGYTRSVPLGTNGLPQWGSAAAWSSPLSSDFIPGVPMYTWIANGRGIVTEPIWGYGVTGSYHIVNTTNNNKWGTDWSASAFEISKYLPMIKASLPCAQYDSQTPCTQSDYDNWAIQKAAVASAPQLKSRVWQIFNEPNYKWQDNTKPLDAAKMYNALYDQLKAIDPNARLYCCGLYEAPDPDTVNTWLNTFRSNVTRPIDGIHFHNYAYDADTVNWPSNFYDDQQIINVMQNHFYELDDQLTAYGQNLQKSATLISEWGGLYPDESAAICERSGDNNDNEADVMRAVATWMNDNAHTYRIVGAGWYLAGASTLDFNTEIYTNNSGTPTYTCLGDEYFNGSYTWGQTP